MIQASQQEFIDEVFGIRDGTDPTKLARFEASTIATGTEREYTFPNADGTLALEGWVSDNFLALSGGTMTGTIDMGDNPIVDVGWIDFNLINGIAQQEGRMSWNDDDGTLNLGLKGGVVNLQIGQEMVVRGKNSTGGIISDGAAVRISSASGTPPFPEFGLSDSDNTVSDASIGLATEDISNGGFGYATVYGRVRGINTTGAPVSEVWAAGEALYVSDTPGELTNVMPAGVNRVIFIGYVIRAHATEGSIHVSPINVPFLEEVSGVDISSALNHELLFLNGDNGTWENTTGLEWDNATGLLTVAQITTTGDITSGNDFITTAGELLSPSWTIPKVAAQQLGYNISMDSNVGLIIQAIDGTASTQMFLCPTPADGATQVIMGIRPLGEKNAADTEAFQMLYAASGQYRLQANAEGSGSRHDIVIAADGTATQMVFSTASSLITTSGDFNVGNDLDVDNDLNVDNDALILGTLTINGSFVPATDPNLILKGTQSGSPATALGCHIEMHSGTIVGGYVFANGRLTGGALSKFVWKKTVQTDSLDEGVAFVSFDDGSASFGSQGFTISATGVPSIRDGQDIRLNDVGNSNYVGFKAPALTANQIWTLPTADGTNNDIIKTNGSGVLSFVTPTSHTQLSFSMYDAEPSRGSETSLDGAFISLATAQPLNSVPTDLVVSKGIGKLVVVVNAGSDFVGDITVTGTSVDRDTGATTGADTDTLTIDALTTDNSDTDTNGNTRHAFTGAYITSKWFTGTVTLSTTDLTLTDVDVYHVSFEQFDDTVSIVLDTFDANILTTNVNAEFDAYLYSIMVTGDKCNIAREASLNVGADGETAIADRYWRLRRGGIDKSLNGTTDGTWVDIHYSNSPAYVEDVSVKVWATETVPLTLT